MEERDVRPDANEGHSNDQRSLGRDDPPDYRIDYQVPGLAYWPIEGGSGRIAGLD
jgi:hypothetical protein